MCIVTHVPKDFLSYQQPGPKKFFCALRLVILLECLKCGQLIFYPCPWGIGEVAHWSLYLFTAKVNSRGGWKKKLPLYALYVYLILS